MPDKRSVATLALVMVLLLTASIGGALAVPELPLPVREALAYVPEHDFRKE